ncbi:MAG: PHP-associated domain-containing protein [Candidatus Jordarchaeum sp.]|uniref:PHP-associated domain-containing protein n=1 Tax=Candidatus Jordarchaeum sp. TaxID=2823881 RepID=UPI004049763F
MKKFDLHVHTCCSKHDRWGVDCLNTPREMVEAAIRVGLDGIAVSDHNTTRGGLMAAKVAREMKKDFLVIPSLEIKTKEGDILALGVLEEVNIIGKAMTAGEAVEKMRERCAVLIAPHPYSREGVGEALVEKLKFDALEVFNSRMLSRHNKKAKELAFKLGLPMIACSDAHIVDDVGNGITGININELSINCVKKALLEGDIQIFKEERSRNRAQEQYLKLCLLLGKIRSPPCEEKLKRAVEK